MPSPSKDHTSYVHTAAEIALIPSVLRSKCELRRSEHCKTKSDCRNTRDHKKCTHSIRGITLPATKLHTAISQYPALNVHTGAKISHSALSNPIRLPAHQRCHSMHPVHSMGSIASPALQIIHDHMCAIDDFDVKAARDQSRPRVAVSSAMACTLDRNKSPGPSSEWSGSKMLESSPLLKRQDSNFKLRIGSQHTSQVKIHRFSETRFQSQAPKGEQRRILTRALC